MTVPVPVTLRSHNLADLAYPDIQAYLKECDLCSCRWPAPSSTVRICRCRPIR